MGRSHLSFTVLCATALFVSAPALAQKTPAGPTEYPNRPVRIIVPQAAGAGVDVVARQLAQKLSETWGPPSLPRS